MKTGIELIAEERQEQIQKHGRTVASDIVINNGCELAEAASGLCHPVIPSARKRFSVMPLKWDDESLIKMCKKSYKERLVISGALIAAEIDRLNARE